MGKKEDSEFQDHYSIINDSSQAQVYRRPKKQMKYQKGEAKGKWTQLQKLQYLAFFQFLNEKQYLRKENKLNKTFKMMSEYVTTRNLLQCRSHHQKMLEKYGGIKNIVQKLKKELDQDNYNRFYKQNIQKLEKVVVNYTSLMFQKKTEGHQISEKLQKTGRMRQLKCHNNRNQISSEQPIIQDRNDLRIQYQQQMNQFGYQYVLPVIFYPCNI